MCLFFLRKGCATVEAGLGFRDALVKPLRWASNLVKKFYGKREVLVKGILLSDQSFVFYLKMSKSGLYCNSDKSLHSAIFQSAKADYNFHKRDDDDANILCNGGAHLCS
jgi:hypothetical protein